MLQPLVRRTWAERGRTPVMDQWDRHDRVTAISALALSPRRKRIRFYFQLLTHNATADDFVWFLHDLRQELRRKMIVVWDRLSAHRRTDHALAQLGCRWVRFEYLPPYAPELNPVEHLWTTAKWGALANTPADDADHLWQQVNDTLDGHHHEQRLLRGHFHWAGLDLT